MSTVTSLRTQGISAREACDALDVSSATYYRRQHPQPARAARHPPSPPRALSAAERQHVLEILHSERFVDSSPGHVSATLLDDDQLYLCSPRTMYRILDSEREVRERRDQVRRPNYAKPELLAQGPNEVWSWDITKLRGQQKWSYYYLYVLLDIFSRFVVG